MEPMAHVPRHPVASPLSDGLSEMAEALSRASPIGASELIGTSFVIIAAMLGLFLAQSTRRNSCNGITLCVKLDFCKQLQLKATAFSIIIHLPEL